MTESLKTYTILIADDDPEDCMLVADAALQAGLTHRIQTVHDGEALLEYLNGCTNHNGSNGHASRPDLVLLDLNMPRFDGRQALAEIKKNESLRRIPVVILTTSSTQSDIIYAYETGASSFITKPVTFQGWIDLMTMLDQYWFQNVMLPGWE
jgi:CheY-like chemotaxis protein